MVPRNLLSLVTWVLRRGFCKVLLGNGLVTAHMSYDRAMNRRLDLAAIACVAATCGLVACSTPAQAPKLQVTSVSVSEGKQMAEQFCSDLAKMSQEKAISRMATRAAAAELSSSDQDAIVDYAAAVTCPDRLP